MILLTDEDRFKLLNEKEQIDFVKKNPLYIRYSELLSPKGESFLNRY